MALHQLAETVTKRAPRLDPSKTEDLVEFMNITAHPGEGCAGDLQSLWSAAWASLVIGGAHIELTQDSAILHTDRHHLVWSKRKLAFQVLREAIQSGCSGPE